MVPPGWDLEDAPYVAGSVETRDLVTDRMVNTDTRSRHLTATYRAAIGLPQPEFAQTLLEFQQLQHILRLVQRSMSALQFLSVPSAWTNAYGGPNIEPVDGPSRFTATLPPPRGGDFTKPARHKHWSSRIGLLVNNEILGTLAQLDVFVFGCSGKSGPQPVSQF
jgi:hypothetical protein